MASRCRPNAQPHDAGHLSTNPSTSYIADNAQTFTMSPATSAALACNPYQPFNPHNLNKSPSRTSLTSSSASNGPGVSCSPGRHLGACAVRPVLPPGGLALNLREHRVKTVIRIPIASPEEDLDLDQEQDQDQDQDQDQGPADNGVPSRVELRGNTSKSENPWRLEFCGDAMREEFGGHPKGVGFDGHPKRMGFDGHPKGDEIDKHPRREEFDGNPKKMGFDGHPKSVGFDGHPGRQEGRRSDVGVVRTTAGEVDEWGRRGRRGEEAVERTPSRARWRYRSEGILVQEIDEGQRCLDCEDKCDGFTAHAWRKTCNRCKCPREAHEVCHEEWVNVRTRLGFQPASGDVRAQRDKVADGFTWVPPGLATHKIEAYFVGVPAGKVPRAGSTGDKYRDRQLAWQLPKQDLALAYCKHVEPQHHASYEDFINARNEIALDIAYVTDATPFNVECGTCNRGLAAGEVGVAAAKFGERTLWHPGCFVCSACGELLVDLTYCVHDDLLYCERHYAEQLKPRCAACDELIFSGEYTKAMSKDWHSGHFCCWQCDESLTGQRYVLRDDHPYCIKCYESVFANMCEECNKTIGIDSKDLSYKDKHWHEACFLCNKCRVSLVDKQFGSKADKIYCGNCYDSQFASRCDGCGEIFRAGTKKMEYKTRQWHEKCFCCCVCKSAIGTKSFIPREQEIYCATCYEEKFATRCVKCNKIITSGGVTYKNEPWHRECFTCSHCSASLAGQRFTSRDDKPYCADCFGELFAKRCTACVKPITGIGGTRFISFEDRHWHNDCFICASCKTSLVGRGFITDADDIICPECAKQKLM